MYILWTVHTVEFIHGGTYTRLDLRTEGTYTKRDIHTEGIYTWKSKDTERLTHGENIHMEGHIQRDIHTEGHTHDETYALRGHTHGGTHTLRRYKHEGPNIQRDTHTEGIYACRNKGGGCKEQDGMV